MTRPRVSWMSRTSLWFATIALATAVHSQPVPRAYKVGWLSHGEPQEVADFRTVLRDAGFVEGRNVVFELRHARGDVDALPALVAELVASKVDVIVTVGEPAAHAAKRATSTIPIVVTELGQDPVAAGLVAKLGRPEGNVTGFATMSDDLWQKRLGYLAEVMPNLSRLTVVSNPANPGNTQCVAQIRASVHDVRVEVMAVGDDKSLQQALAPEETPGKAAPRKDKRANSPGNVNEFTHALTTCLDSTTLAAASTIAAVAAQRGVPMLAPAREYVDAGALLSYGADLSTQRRRAARYVEKLLKGARPADLPFEQASAFDLVLNLRTAKALGRPLPPTLVLLADDAVK